MRGDAQLGLGDAEFFADVLEAPNVLGERLRGIAEVAGLGANEVFRFLERGSLFTRVNWDTTDAAALGPALELQLGLTVPGPEVSGEQHLSVDLRNVRS